MKEKLIKKKIKKCEKLDKAVEAIGMSIFTTAEMLDLSYPEAIYCALEASTHFVETTLAASILGEGISLEKVEEHKKEIQDKAKQAINAYLERAWK